MAFTAYLDDSGTSPSQPVAIATVLLVPNTQILRLETEWDAFRKKYEFDDFHASLCAARNHKSIYASWSDEKLTKVFFRVRNFCKKFGVQMYSFAIKKKDYEEVVPENLRRYSGSYHTWGIRHLSKRVEEWRQSRGIKKSIEYIFDWVDSKDLLRREIQAAMSQLSETIREAVHYDFKRRKDVPGLQCVDFLAWLSYQLSLDCLKGKDALPLAVDALKDLENYYPARRGEHPAQKWFQVATVKRAELSSWAEWEYLQERPSLDLRIGLEGIPKAETPKKSAL